MTGNMFERTAMSCSEWPDWLQDAVDEAIDVSDKMEWSTEQVLAYAILQARYNAFGEATKIAEAAVSQAIRQHSQKGRDKNDG